MKLSKVSVIRQGKELLGGLDLSIRQGQCCAIIGPNGAGKSTLIAVMSGYIWPTLGSVSIFGKTYGQVDISTVRQKLGVIESSRLPAFPAGYSARNVAASGLFGTIVLPPHRTVDWKMVDEELDLLGLSALGGHRFGDLSTGEQMKFSIARAMLSQPKLLILDEPTAGLDMGARTTVVATLERLLERSDPPTLIVVSHHLDELPYSLSQVVLLKRGRVLAQGPAGQVMHSQNLSRLFDCQVELDCTNGRYFAKVNVST